MNDYLINLLDYTSVRGWLITIYDRLKSRSMPPTSDGGNSGRAKYRGCCPAAFCGPAASAIDEGAPEAWRHTTLGDMGQDSRHIGYDYAPPVAPQLQDKT